MRKTILTTSLVGVTLALPAVSMAELVVSGQVTPAIVFSSDIEDPEVVDNTGTGSRIRIRDDSEFLGMKTFTRYEIQIQENQSFGDVDGGEFIDTRYAEVGIKGAFGSLSLGKGDGASNATAEGSYQVSGNFLGGGHLPFFTVRGALNRDNPEQTVGYTFYDGFSRNSRLRYDTPGFGGFTASASLASGDRYELAARLKRAAGPGKVTLLAGYADSSDGTNDRTMFSGGYRFNAGFSFAFSFSSRTQADNAPDLDSELFSLNYQIGSVIYSYDFGSQGVDGENEIQQIGAEFKATKTTDIYGGFVNFDNADDTSVATAYAGFRYKF